MTRVQAPQYLDHPPHSLETIQRQQAMIAHYVEERARLLDRIDRLERSLAMLRGDGVDETPLDSSWTRGT